MSSSGGSQAARPERFRRLGQGRAGSIAIVCVVLAWALQMHSMGWAQSANYAQVRVLNDGHAEIDRWHWETRDKAWINGHFYSVKAPGLALVSTPLYAALRSVGGVVFARHLAADAAHPDADGWVASAQPPYSEFGFSRERARRVERRVERGAPMVWALTLLGAVLPGMILLFLVRGVAERFEPGYGTAAAVTLGVGTIVMTFAGEFFPHVLAATLGFGAFALLLRERDGPPRTAYAGGAGLLAGLAVSCEYQLAILGVILFGYLLSRPGRLRRGAAFAACSLIGAVPALLFNAWALGSPLRFAYGSAVAVQGSTGHFMLGLNDGGLFGIGLPKLDAAVNLLIADRGLLTLTPVLAMALFGVLVMRRRGHRAESNVIFAVSAAFFLYNAGYWLPFGGGSPGPRFLIPAMPFLAVGLASAYRRAAGPTLALAIPSGVFMVAGALSFPLIGDSSASLWVDRMRDGNLEPTVLSVLGVSNNWLAATPILAAILVAIVAAALATPRTAIGPTRAAAIAIASWIGIAVFGPAMAGDVVTPLSGGGDVFLLIAAGACTSAATLLAIRQRELRDPVLADSWGPEASAEGSSS